MRRRFHLYDPAPARGSIPHIASLHPPQQIAREQDSHRTCIGARVSVASRNQVNLFRLVYDLIRHIDRVQHRQQIKAVGDVVLKPTLNHGVAVSAIGVIVLQKSLCTGDQKFSGPQARFSCKDVRGLIASA
jgi:hypothetical protein